MITDDQRLAQINEVLAEMRPSIQMHGGDLELVKVDADEVYVRLTGACITCPISAYTLKFGIEQTIKEKISGISRVIQVEGYNKS